MALRLVLVLERPDIGPISSVGHASAARVCTPFECARIWTLLNFRRLGAWRSEHAQRGSNHGGHVARGAPRGQQGMLPSKHGAGARPVRFIFTAG